MEMNKNTYTNEEILNALNKSIEHWKDNINKLENGEIFFINGFECSLCKLFKVTSCQYCPLYEYSKGCNENDSPWCMVWEHAKYHTSINPKDYTDEELTKLRASCVEMYEELIDVKKQFERDMNE